MMGLRQKIHEEKFLIKIVEAAAIVGIMVLLSLLFDYRYAMNDDVFIASIISGKYTGIPDNHNIQIIVLLNTLFSGLYQLNNAIPWFGLFLVTVQFLSLYSILICLAKKLNFHEVTRLILLISANILLISIMVCELVMIQYTYAAALLMTSATMDLYCTGEMNFASKRSIFCYIRILLQYLLAFCLRTEIFLFLLPFSVLLTIICYYRNNRFALKRKEIGQWSVFWGSLVLGVFVLYGLDHAAYPGQDWQEYRRVFEYRTQLYDFLALPSYEDNQEFYRSAGISEVQYELLKNYNLSLDEEITSETLRSVVDYVNDSRISEHQGISKVYYGMFRLPLKEGVWSYAHRVLFDRKLAQEDYPWNIVCMALYFVFLLLTLLSGRIQNIVYMVFMFFLRSGLWMYIILKQRTPPRVTHSLFLMEMVCLLVLIFEEMSWLHRNGSLRKKKMVLTLFSAFSLAGAGAVAVYSCQGLGMTYEKTVAFNEEWEELLAYCRDREDNFYFMDVYSTVNYSEAIFTGRYSGLENYDICGGWLAKSPLCGEKYGQFGIDSVPTALIEKDNVYFVAEEGSDLAWLSALYEEKGIDLELECREKVAEHFCIYHLKRK